MDTYARFYVHPQKQHDDSYKDVVYVEIFIKGDKNTSYGRPKKDEDETKYPAAWKSFITNSPVMSDGNPLSVLPGLGPSDAMNLQSMGIQSVEDLAELSERAVSNIQGGRTLKARAQAYLSALSVEKKLDDDIDEEFEIPENVIPKGDFKDLLEKNAPEIVKELDMIPKERLGEMLEAEKSGKARKGLIAEIEKEMAA